MNEFNEGDKATVIRGKHRGEVTVVAKSANGEYAVRTAGGEIVMVKPDNMKAPQEPSVLRSDLATAIIDVAGLLNDEGKGALQHLVNELGLPGLADLVRADLATNQAA